LIGTLDHSFKLFLYLIDIVRGKEGSQKASFKLIPVMDLISFCQPPTPGRSREVQGGYRFGV